MPRKHFDADSDDDDYCGVVGGEVTDASYAGERGQEYDFGPVHDVSARLTGDEYAYLGHFRRPEFASEGHNDIQMPGLPALHTQGPSMGSPGLGAMRQGPIGSRINSAINNAIDKELGSLGGRSEDADYGGGGDTAQAAGDLDASGGGDATGLLGRLF